MNESHCYALLPHDMDAYFYDRDLMSDLFCKACGARLANALRQRPLRVGRKLEIGMTYDGVVLMSPAIGRLLHEISGAEIRGLDTNFGEYFYFDALDEIDVDLTFRPVLFENACSECGVFSEVSQALPMRLVDDTSMASSSVKKTSVQFGEGWLRAPIVVIGADLYAALRQARAYGLEAAKIHSSTTERWW